MKLMLVEAPQKVETITKLLDSDWVVLPSGGHIRDLPENDLGISENGFQLEYVWVPRRPIPKGGGKFFPGGADRVAKIREAMKSASMVFLATDKDREGEAISWHLFDALGLTERDYQRVAFTELSKRAIASAIENPRKIDMPLVYAQEARRALDRMVGYLVSPVMSDVLGETVAVGRVQSVAVRLIIELESRIHAFKVTNHFDARVWFDNKAWCATWNRKPYLAPGQEYLLDESLASRAAECREFRVAKMETGVRKEAPPRPFSTSLLLQAASVHLKFSTGKTETLYKALYAQGAINYPRTDSVNLGADAIEEVRVYAASLGLPLSEKPRRWKEKASAQEGHECIRPKHMEDEEAGTTDDERALYRLIRLRTLACQLADARYDTRTVTLEADNGGERFEFIGKGSVRSYEGWQAVMSGDQAEDAQAKADAGDGEGDEDSGAVPLMAENSTKRAENGELLKKKTRPPIRFTEASLVKYLEDSGIGRPATFPSIIRTIFGRAYVEEKQRYLYPTQHGVDIVVALIRAGFAFIEVGYTADLEEQLDLIAAGRRDYVGVVGDEHARLQATLARIAADPNAKPKHSCPKCGSGLRRTTKDKRTFWVCSKVREGCETFLADINGVPVLLEPQPCPKCETPMRRFKRKVGADYFWKCPAEECGTFMDDANGKAVPRKVHLCPSCGREMRRVKGTSGFFWSCTGYKEGCEKTMDDKAGVPVERVSVPCPRCKRPMRRMKGKGKKGFFWGCSGWKEGCSMTAEDVKGKPKFR